MAVLPAAEHELSDGTVELSLTPVATRQIGLVWSAEHALAPAALVFRDFVLDGISAAGLR